MTSWGRNDHDVFALLNNHPIDHNYPQLELETDEEIFGRNNPPPQDDLFQDDEVFENFVDWDEFAIISDSDESSQDSSSPDDTDN